MTDLKELGHKIKMYVHTDDPEASGKFQLTDFFLTDIENIKYISGSFFSPLKCFKC